MLIAEFDEVAQICRPSVDPVADVVHIGELSVGAAGESTPLVPAPDLQPLSI